MYSVRSAVLVIRVFPSSAWQANFPLFVLQIQHLPILIFVLPRAHSMRFSWLSCQVCCNLLWWVNWLHVRCSQATQLLVFPVSQGVCVPRDTGIAAFASVWAVLMRWKLGHHVKVMSFVVIHGVAEDKWAI